MKFRAAIVAAFMAVGCSHHPAPRDAAPAGVDTVKAVWAARAPSYKTVESLLLFGIDADTLTANQLHGLSLTAQKANRRGDPLVISGFADTSGSEAHNLALSQRRADVVYDALVRFGCTVPISVSAQGEVSDIPVWSRRVTIKTAKE